MGVVYVLRQRSAFSLMNSSSLEPDSSVIDRLRGAYQQLSNEEKAKIVAFAARRRFTNDLFETWLKQSGLESSEILRAVADEQQSEPVRERLDAALLKDGNEQLLIEAITKYLTEGNQDLLASVRDWVARAKAVGGEAAFLEAPADLQGHPQSGMLEALVRGGLLDPALVALMPKRESAELPVEAPSVAIESVTPPEGLVEHDGLPQDKTSALEHLDELDELVESIQSDIDRIRNVSGAIDLGALERKLRRANLLSWGLHQFAGNVGAWETGAGLREVIGAIPDMHRIWATALADFLEGVPINHPLRRKRESAETIRDAAVGELRNFADLGGIEETVPGPFEDACEWWRWATALSDDQFADIEDWCSANSLDHLADFIAEQWTLTMNRERSASAVSEAMSEALSTAMNEARAALRVDSTPSQAFVSPEVDDHTEAAPSFAVSRQGSLIAAMEVARKQAELGGSAPLGGGDAG